MYYSAITATFSSAHALRHYAGKCERLHGHNWRVEVVVAAERLDPAGMGLDFTVLRAKTAEVIGEMDHRYLNELEPFLEVNPSSELIARYIHERLSTSVNDGRVKVSTVKVWESEGSWAEYRSDCE
jgi:6-pyruvoyltetrahydropterin/6-carboxytetrahydropterin synthase